MSIPSLRPCMCASAAVWGVVQMDDPNITMEEYIRLEEEKAHRYGKVYNWETATYGKIWYDEDVHDLKSVETKFPAIVFNDELTSEEALSCEPTVRKGYHTKRQKTMQKKHIDEFNLKDETSLSECDEEEQNILCINGLIAFLRLFIPTVDMAYSLNEYSVFTHVSIRLITEYLVNISKRRAFWSLNEDILKITILRTNTPFPSRKRYAYRACTTQRPQENANPPAISNHPILPDALRARFNQELQELQKILAFVTLRLEKAPLVSPFPHSDNDSDDEEVLIKFREFRIAGSLCRERIINSLDGDDLAFECMIGFRKFTAYLDPFLLMNIISRKAYNTIMVDRLEGMGKNLVAIFRDVYVFVGSFTYITYFIVLEDIGEFIMSDMAEVLMSRPFRRITKLKYDVARGLVSFTKIFDTYTYRMPSAIPRLKNFNWSKVPPLLELSQNNLMNRFRHPYEKNKFMYKNCLNLGPEYQVDENMKEWLIRGHVSIHEST
ncbi:hypothetical protein Tco_1466138 [Tanacetum coccineum]